MILRGKLCLNRDDDYLIVDNGKATNLSEVLNVMLLEDVKVKIKNMYDGKHLFSAEGKLVKDKISKSFYLYCVDNRDMDSILWNLVDRKLEVELVNVTIN